MDLLATTNRGLEQFAADEIERLTGASARVHHPGWVAFEGTPRDVVTLNSYSRTLHRVLVSLVDRPATSLGEMASLSESVPVESSVEPSHRFAVESTRIGTHDFESPDVADVVGQAIRDSHADATGDQLVVDLDDPDVVFRAVVRHDRFTLALDTTGPVSLHRRPYRVVDHEAPVRPTIAAVMLDIAGVGSGTTVADPFCGVGTIPIEAALTTRGRSPNAGRDSFAFEALPSFDDELTTDPEPGRDDGPLAAGADIDRSALVGARTNAAQAAVPVEFVAADARETVPAVDVVVTDLPFGIRTDHGDLRPLYREFCTAAEASTAERLVALTTRPDLLTLPPAETYDFRDGRLDVTIADIPL